MAEKKIQLLEHKEEVYEEQNKGFFSRLFSSLLLYYIKNITFI